MSNGPFNNAAAVVLVDENDGVGAACADGQEGAVVDLVGAASSVDADEAGGVESP